MNLDLIFESLQPNQLAQLADLKQRLLDTYDINHVPVPNLVLLMAEFATILKLASYTDMGHCLNPNFGIIDKQLAKMLLNVLATIQQRDTDYQNTINQACRFTN